MTTTWLNFKELRQRLDFAEVLKHYGVELKLRRGNQHQGFCPLPTHQGKKRSPSFSANLDRRIFKCFGCGASGDLYQYVARMEGLDPENGQDIRKVALLLAERYRLEEKQPTSPKGTRDEKPRAAQNKAEQASTCPAIVNAPLDFTLSGLDSDHPYLKERGFTLETISHFGLGYCSRGLMQGRIVIPLHDAAGRLIGYAGRLVDDSRVNEENPKYLFPGTRERQGKRYEFHKSLFLYNGFAVGKIRDLIVVEGFASVWWLSQHGFLATVALMGWSCSVEQAKLMEGAVDPDGRVWVMPDADEAGERCAAEVLRLVSPHRNVRWVQLSNGEQPTDCTHEELAGLLAGLAREGRAE